ncbi:MAG: ABC transporter substrate-binding protein [Clostridiales Family XIII bacterium]|nr:ABC transporter substrate-binding protein [Clostridiales Family XIII bacterium]
MKQSWMIGKKHGRGAFAVAWIGRRFAVCLAVAVLFAVLALASCGRGDAVYELKLDGKLNEPGVIRYLDFTMNVYADVATNPCGDCEDQPVSVYVGDDALTVAAALKQALETDFADGDWLVTDLNGTSLFVERAPDTGTDEPEAPSAPVGLLISGGTTERSPEIAGRDGSSDIPDDPGRIAAVYGPSYEALVALGAEDRIAVRADVQTENFPWAFEVYRRIGELPVLEDVHAAVNIETLLSHDPDLVYTFPRPNEVALLDKAHIGYIEGATTKTLDDVKGLLFKFAAPLGEEAVARAEAYAAYFDEKLTFVRERTRDLPEAERPKVYYAGTDILTTYGRQADVVEAIEAAGGTAVTRELEGGNRVNTDAEKLAAWNPDWIFLDHCGMSGSEKGSVDEIVAAAYDNPKYAGITAIKEQRIVPTPSGVFYWDMGIQKILLIEYMAKTIHPELFEDVDMASEIQDFYARFFDHELSREDAEKILERQLP